MTGNSNRNKPTYNKGVVPPPKIKRRNPPEHDLAEDGLICCTLNPAHRFKPTKLADHMRKCSELQKITPFRCKGNPVTHLYRTQEELDEHMEICSAVTQDGERAHTDLPLASATPDSESESMHVWGDEVLQEDTYSEGGYEEEESGEGSSQDYEGIDELLRPVLRSVPVTSSSKENRDWQWAEKKRVECIIQNRKPSKRVCEILGIDELTKAMFGEPQS